MKLWPFLMIVIIGMTSCHSTETESMDAGEQVKEDTVVPDDSSTEKILGYFAESSRLAWQKPGKVLDYFGDIHGKVIADIGAGSGFFTLLIPARGAKVIAVDIDASALATIDELINLPNYDATLRKQIDMRLAKPDNPLLDPDEVDGILIVNTIAYLPDRLQYLKHLRTALKPNGTILIVDYKMKRIPLSVPRGERVPLFQIEDDLYTAGYTGITVDECVLDYQYIIRAHNPGNL
ncbi:MAG: methyltransferase [Saprospiraceae bacterium]